MNIRHWQDNVSGRYQQDGNATRQPFFSSPLKCRIYIQTGIASWSCSVPVSASNPCCDLDVIGGDGTHIGVSAKQVMKMPSIWIPDKDRDSYLKWGRSSRRPASFKERNVDDSVVIVPSAVAIGSQVSKACTFAVVILRDHQKNSLLSSEKVESSTMCLPNRIRMELMRWFGRLTITSSQWRPLQQSLLAGVSSESICGAFPRNCISDMSEMLSLNEQLALEVSVEFRRKSMMTYLTKSYQSLSQFTMPLHAWNLVKSQVDHSDSDGRMLDTTYPYIRFLGNHESIKHLSF